MDLSLAAVEDLAAQADRLAQANRELKQRVRELRGTAAIASCFQSVIQSLFASRPQTDCCAVQIQSSAATRHSAKVWLTCIIPWLIFVLYRVE